MVKAERRSVEITIADNGCGFDVEASRATGGSGLSSMGERVRLLNDRALALAFEKYGKELSRIHRYETAISRAFHKALKDLETRQYQRHRMEALLAMQEAKRKSVGSVSQNFSETLEMPITESHGTPKAPFASSMAMTGSLN